MSGHYISKIEIHKLRHLNDISIELSASIRKNLIITGKNGVGKTTLLNAIGDYLVSIEKRDYTHRKVRFEDIISQIDPNSIEYDDIMDLQRAKRRMEEYSPEIDLYFNDDLGIENFYDDGEFIIDFFTANRVLKMEESKGVENIQLKKQYSIFDPAGDVFIKYLVHLKTQQIYAQSLGDEEYGKKIGMWFEQFENLLREIYKDDNLVLKFNYRAYDFVICQSGREPFNLNEMSDGYSAILVIVTNLIIKCIGAAKGETIKNPYDIEGIVLIDEIETHLHLELQKIVLKFLTTLFPNIQFIVTTHSPFVLNSIENAVIYDLENCIKIEDMSAYSYSAIVEQYFGVSKYSRELKIKLEDYRKLAFKKDISDDDRAKRAQLRNELKNACSDVARELKNEFFDIELERKKHDKD